MYSRRGDRGETSLFGPRRVPKDSPRVEAYGEIDELNSLLGVVISHCRDASMVTELRAVQNMLFVAGGDLAAEDGAKPRVPRISHQHTMTIEAMTDSVLRSLPPLKNFILPGGSRVGAELQLARAVCRRTERRIVAASRTEGINQELLPFFNRLSSYLFNLSRLANKREGKKETTWRGEG
jgi:cob(I)alamin adenosyltransferase